MTTVGGRSYNKIMPIIQPSFVNNHYYHLFNRGVAKQTIYHDDRDYNRFLDVLAFYTNSEIDDKFSRTEHSLIDTIRNTEIEKPLVEIIAFCLMPNHFHLLVKQVSEHGITLFLRRATNSYVHYYNTKRNRVGTIFQDRKSVV